MWLFWLFIYGPPNCVLAEETALPVLVFEAAWLQELVFDTPAKQNPFWWLAWPIDEEAEVPPPFGSEPLNAAETELAKLVFEAAWLQELVFDVPAIQNDFWSLTCPMNDDAEVPLPVGVPLIDNAKTGFDVVVARTSSPEAIIDAIIGSNFLVLIFCY
jgi:hypothetical protein